MTRWLQKFWAEAVFFVNVASVVALALLAAARGCVRWTWGRIWRAARRLSAGVTPQDL